MPSFWYSHHSFGINIDKEKKRTHNSTRSQIAQSILKRANRLPTFSQSTVWKCVCEQSALYTRTTNIYRSRYTNITRVRKRTVQKSERIWKLFLTVRCRDYIVKSSTQNVKQNRHCFEPNLLLTSRRLFVTSKRRVKYWSEQSNNNKNCMEKKPKREKTEMCTEEKCWKNRNSGNEKESEKEIETERDKKNCCRYGKMLCVCVA